MKILLLITTMAFALQTFAENTVAFSQMLKDGKCVPFRDQTGEISSYKCDKKEFETKMQAYLTKKHNEPSKIKKTATKSETIIVQPVQKVSGQLQMCLIGLSMAQNEYFKINHKFANAAAELNMSQNIACKGVEISFDRADDKSYLAVAKLMNEAWSMDQSKNLTQIH